MQCLPKFVTNGTQNKLHLQGITVSIKLYIMSYSTGRPVSITLYRIAQKVSHYQD